MASSSSSSLLHLKLNLVLLLFILETVFGPPVLGCYTSIFSFGDSLADTGNFLYSKADKPSNIGNFPYFHRPTGRCSCWGLCPKII
ncbi:hypothetical protein BVC80_659g11 [Macleaya cordata]|uniref:Lipase n=1 Tax=Macleaya cordata TaxID=56857 RepID=A0A200QFE6_MACCD|nr:hypothetical protein BVC80_659g11 [Macleaya cordata]